jgi:tRNA modification GTPase
VLDLIQAKTDQTLRWAASQLEGSLSRKMKGVKEELMNILSHLEAAIDFPDDFPETRSVSEAGARLEELKKKVKALLDSSALGLLAKRGLKVVIVGRPNVGKSSLMNCLIQSNRVIVTPYPGTTRDVVEEEIQLAGFPVRISDTAGIQETEHPIEKEGIERSRKAALGADLVLFVIDGSDDWRKQDGELLEEIEKTPKIIVINKMDLPQKLDRQKLLAAVNDGTPVLESSCETETGLKDIEEELVRFMTGGKAQFSDEAVISSSRQREFLEKMSNSLTNALEACSKDLSPELIAVDVRLALDQLGGLVGEVATDDVLDVLFGHFCIGK